jgi:hypothetical protein
MKVADKDENDRISDMFALMSNFAFLQTGLNKSKLSYTNVVDFTNFLDVMKSESESFTTALALDGNNILDKFFEKFVSVNSRRNINKGRFKDYLMDIDFEAFKNVIPDTQPTGAATQLLDVDIKFEEDKNTGYAARTKINASADATVALAVNFDSAGEKLTKSTVLNQNKKYIPIDVKDSLSDIGVRANKIVQQLNSVNAQTLNIAGNGIYTMNGKYTQQEVDNFTYELLKAVVESPNLKNKIISVRTGGQTGFDEAGAKAGVKLGIPTTILAPKGWKFRDISGTDISNEEAFKARFTTQPTERKTYSGKVTSLQPNQIFVFGSNPEGRHGAGAAKYAKDNFGAIYGQGEGLQGQSYALPTKDLRVKENKSLRSISPEDITSSIRKLYDVARQNATKEFLVSDYSETNLNGYTGQEMADMFINAGPIPSNIVFNKNFDKLITTQPTETRIAQPTETEDTPFELKETDRTNVFQYQDQLGDKDFYEKLVDANQTVVFVRNNVNETYSNKKKNFGGQQELDKFAGNMTMNITTSLTKLGDNFQNLPKQAYAEVMRLWEEEIAHIQSINDGQTKFTPIAFPETGFGDPALMPQELFVYLSTRLFDAFGYVNPGSAMYNEMQKRTEIAEGLTDQEILDQLGLEEDPFKCE